MKFTLPLIYIINFYIYFVYVYVCISVYVYISVSIYLHIDKPLILSLENSWLVRNYKTDRMSDMFKGFLRSQSLEQSPCNTELGNS